MFAAIIRKDPQHVFSESEICHAARSIASQTPVVAQPAPHVAFVEWDSRNVPRNGIRRCVSTGHIFAVHGDVPALGPPSALLEGICRDGRLGDLRAVNGQFAFAHWDKSRQVLIAARDHLGIEPLYYAETEAQITVSSHAAVAAAFSGWPSLDIDWAALGRFLCFNYNPGITTIRRGVSKFPPGHYAEISRGGLRLVRYWKLSFADVLQDSETAIADQLRDRIQRAVSLRSSDLRLPGVFVSGGLDSSTVLGVLSHQKKRDIVTFSYRCRGVGFDESRYAQLMAESVQSRHCLVEYSPQDVDLMVDLVRQMNEPFCDVGINIATALLGRAATRSTNCVLTGDGGDELFGGHPVYEADKIARLTDFLPEWFTVRLGLALSSLRDSDKKKTLAVKLKRYGESLRFPRDLRTNRWRLYYLPEDLKRLLHPDIGETITSEALYGDILKTYREADARDPLGQALYSDYHTVVDFYLRRNDLNRTTGLETRLPYLDVDLVEFCARIPSRLKIHGWFDTKYIMRKAVEPWLPEKILHREDKLGHSIPLKNWMRQDQHVREFVGDLLARERLTRRGLVNPDYVSRLWNDHMASRVNNSHRLWSLAVLEMWLDHHAGVPEVLAANPQPRWSDESAGRRIQANSR